MTETSKPLHPDYIKICKEIEMLKKHFDFISTSVSDGEYIYRDIVIRTNEDIVLDGLNLGKMLVKYVIYKSHIKNATLMHVVCSAEHPTPSSKDKNGSYYFHPHISKSGHICLGKYSGVINNTYLSKLDIFDAHILIDQIINSYNAASSFRPIKDWNKFECYDCHDFYEEDRIDYCDNCGSPYCDLCSHTCEDDEDDDDYYDDDDYHDDYDD